MWELLTAVAHDWWASAFFCLFIGFATGLMMADAYHTVRCDSPAHNRSWWRELLGQYDPPQEDNNE